VHHAWTVVDLANLELVHLVLGEAKSLEGTIKLTLAIIRGLGTYGAKESRCEDEEQV